MGTNKQTGRQASNKTLRCRFGASTFPLSPPRFVPLPPSRRRIWTPSPPCVDSPTSATDAVVAPPHRCRTNSLNSPRCVCLRYCTVEAKQLSRSTNEAAGGGGGGGAAAALGVPADLVHFSASACRDTTVHRLASWLALASAQSTAHHVHAACHSDAADYVIVMAGRRRRAMDEADASSAGR